jgi:hypothetical protein
MDALLWAMSVELKAMAAVGRATMHGLAQASPEAASAIDFALERELRAAGRNDLPSHYALKALLEEARRRLKPDAA